MGKVSSGWLMGAGILDILLYGTTASMLGTLLPDLSTKYHLSPRQNGEIASLQALGLMESGRNPGVTQLSLGLGTTGTSAETLFPVRYSGPWSWFVKAGAPLVASSAFVAV